MDSLSDALQSSATGLGTVYLVGAGPGDPDLLTLRALDLLRRADLILYDNLASPEVVALGRPDAERRYVGKKRAEHACTQGEITALMVAAARRGKSVVRLKGGDPYIFGRGGEEALGLARAGIPFEVVPGVSSALGAAAYAGIPLTHRDHTQAVTLLTGHDVEQIDWMSLAGRQTLVVFMGLVSVTEIAGRLIAAGLPPETPAAAIRWVTRGDQEVVTGTVASLPKEIERRGLRPPALVVIGEVVALRGEIDWFDKLPLRGQSVVVTRAATQAGSFSGQLRRLGAQVFPLPAIEFEPPSSWQLADQAIGALPEYDWVVFTSVNGVNHFVDRLDASQRDLRDIPGRIAAIGPLTADCLTALHLQVDLVPEQFVAEALGEAFNDHDLGGAKILIPRAERARDFLPEHLASLGAEVDVAPVYRTVLPASSQALADKLWCADQPPDWVTATSSSIVRNLAQLVPVELLRRSKIASIGPVTSATVRELGLQVAAEATHFTTDSLAEAMCNAAANALR